MNNDWYSTEANHIRKRFRKKNANDQFLFLCEEDSTRKVRHSQTIEKLFDPRTNVYFSLHDKKLKEKNIRQPSRPEEKVKLNFSVVHREKSFQVFGLQTKRNSIIDHARRMNEIVSSACRQMEKKKKKSLEQR